MHFTLGYLHEVIFMSGMIRNEDVAYVREHIRIDQVVGDYLPLKQAGGGSAP